MPWADLLGCKGPEATPLDHGRSPHADVGVGSGDDHVAAAQERRISGEAAPRDDAHQRHQAAQTPEEGERLGVEARDDRRIGIARSTTSALGEQHDRQPQPFDQREEPVLLSVVHLALGAGQHGVVVGQDGGAGVRIIEVVAVDAPDPGDQAVGRCVVDEIVEVAARPLCRHDQRAVLLEASGVAQIGDVLAGRPPAPGVTAGRCIGAAGIEGVGHPRPQLGQFGPDRSGGEDLGGVLLGCADHPLLHLEQHGVRRHRVAWSDRYSTNRTRVDRDHLVFHLHGLNDQERLTDMDSITRPNGQS